MTEEKRQKAKTEKTLAKLERGVTERMKIRAHHEARVRTLNTKIAAGEEEIGDLKADL